MSILKTIPFEHQPVRLTDEELQNPLQVIAAFFDNASLGSVREDLRRWYEAAISSEYESHAGGLHRSNLFCLYNQIELLTEAAFALLQKPPSNQPNNEQGGKRKRRSNKNKLQR